MLQSKNSLKLNVQVAKFYLNVARMCFFNKKKLPLSKEPFRGNARTRTGEWEFCRLVPYQLGYVTICAHNYTKFFRFSKVKIKNLLINQHFFSFFIVLWLKTLRIHVHFPKNFRPGVLGIWHRDLPAATAAFQDTGFYAMISESKDGELLAQVAKTLKYKIIRGSGTHGASAIRKLLTPLANQEFVAMALDGPKGPAMVAKPGSEWLSQKANVPLWLVKVDYSLKFSLKSWDKTRIPLPFSKIVIEVDYLYTRNKQSRKSQTINQTKF